jgi:hypothetical protein
MTQLLSLQSSRASFWVKMILCLWMLLIICGYLVLFTPPELAYFIQSIGYSDFYNKIVQWLHPYFSAQLMN